MKKQILKIMLVAVLCVTAGQGAVAKPSTSKKFFQATLKPHRITREAWCGAKFNEIWGLADDACTELDEEQLSDDIDEFVDQCDPTEKEMDYFECIEVAVSRQVDLTWGNICFQTMEVESCGTAFRGSLDLGSGNIERDAIEQKSRIQTPGKLGGTWKVKKSITL